MLRGRISRKATVIVLLLVVIGAYSGPARGAAGIPLDLSPDSLIHDDVVKAVTLLIGFSQQHRPYEPATPLGTQVGVDLSVEVTLIKIPESFFTTLANNGFPMGSSIPSIPAAKLHLHKGFGEFVDVGGSGMVLLGNKMLGADAKIILLQGEEGPTWAFRFCYSYTDLAISGINISTKTYSPQLLISRQMDFADPYLGVALEFATGDLDAAIPAEMAQAAADAAAAGVPVPTLSPAHKSSSAIGGMAFGGLSLKIPRSGLRLTIEGAYDIAGTSSLGTKLGFSF